MKFSAFTHVKLNGYFKDQTSNPQKENYHILTYFSLLLFLFFPDFELISHSSLTPYLSTQVLKETHEFTQIPAYFASRVYAVCRRCFLRIEKSDENFFYTFYKNLKTFLYYLLTKGTWLKLLFMRITQTS